MRDSLRAYDVQHSFKIVEKMYTIDEKKKAKKRVSLKSQDSQDYEGKKNRTEFYTNNKSRTIGNTENKHTR